MKSVSEKYTSKMGENLRRYVPRITIDGTELQGEIQEGMTINLGSCGTESFTIGAMYVPYITASIKECETKLQDKELYLEMGLELDDGTIEYLPMGYYTVEKPSTSKFLTTFTAYGRLMSKFGGLYSTDLLFPAKISDIANEISLKTGISILFKDLDSGGTIVEKPEGLFYREVLQYIAGLLGGFCTETTDGSVLICKYGINKAITLDTAFCYEYPASNDENYQVTGIEVVVSEDGEDEEGNIIPGEKYSSGNPINVTVSNPYMTAALFNACAENVIGFKYLPTAVNFLGDIRIEPWDSIVVTDEEGVEGIDVPCMNICHTWDGGIVTVITAPGSTQTEDESSFAGPITSKVDRTFAELTTTKKLVAEKATITELKAVEAKIDKLDVDELTAKNADIDTLSAINAYLKNLGADEATIKNLIAEKVSADKVDVILAEINDLKTNNATIEQLNAYLVSTNLIKAENASFGYLQAGKADINFANVKSLESASAVIQDLLKAGKIITDEITGTTGSFTSYLTGVRIKGNLIEANTLKADTIILTGTDGLYYQLNANSLGIDKVALDEEKYTKALDGSVIVAESITAEKIRVEDLVAFGATIGGFVIDDSSIQSINELISLESDGNFTLGDSDGGGLFYTVDTDPDTNITTKQLRISADSIVMGNDNNESRTLKSIMHQTNTFKGEYIYVDGLEGINVYFYDTYVESQGSDTVTETIKNYACTINGVVYKVTEDGGVYSKTDETLEFDINDLTLLETTPKAPYEVGDIWLTASNETRICIRSQSEVFTYADWSNDTAAIQKVINNISETLKSAQLQISQLDGNIKSLVVDSKGETLMTQTSEGWVFNFNDILDSEVKPQIDYVDGISPYIRFITLIENSSSVPCIEIGKNSDENWGFKVQITNKEIRFIKSEDGQDSKLAWMNGDDMYIKNAVIDDEFKIGGLTWTERKNGNIGLVWKDD